MCSCLRCEGTHSSGCTSGWRHFGYCSLGLFKETVLGRMSRTVDTLSGRFGNPLYFGRGLLGGCLRLMGWHVLSAVAEWPFVPLPWAGCASCRLRRSAVETLRAAGPASTPLATGKAAALCAIADAAFTSAMRVAVVAGAAPGTGHHVGCPQLHCCHGFVGGCRRLMGWHGLFAVAEGPYVLQRVECSVCYRCQVVAFTSDGSRAIRILVTHYLVAAIHRAIPTTDFIGVGFLLLGSSGLVQGGYAYYGFTLSWFR